MSALIPFAFDGVNLRVMDREGNPWFVLADVCRVLDIGNPSMAGSRLDEDERGISTVETPSGDQQMVVVNESGLYSLVLTSRKPEAKRFKKWITSEVIPTIRKTGSYGVAPQRDPIEVLSDPAAMRGLLLTYSEKVIALQAENAAMAPKVEALDRIATADGSMCITDAAKALQMRPKDLFAYMVQKGWIYRRPGGQGYLGYSDRTQAGFLEHKVTTIERSDGSEKVVERVLVTAKGLARLAEVARPPERVQKPVEAASRRRLRFGTIADCISRTARERQRDRNVPSMWFIVPELCRKFPFSSPFAGLWLGLDGEEKPCISWTWMPVGA